MINILILILFGALSGWIISLLISTNNTETTVRFIIIGIFGALLGGLLTNALKGEPLTRFNDLGILIAVIFSLILIGAMRKLSL